MTADPLRFRDIIPNPCNATVTRRNFEAIRDALEGLVEQLEEPDEDEPGQAGSSQLIFFEVQTTDIGADSVAVKEVLYDTGGGTWGATGADYTAYDWSGRGQYSVNFEQGFLGIGRINTAIASDALEILAIEGRARFVEGTCNEAMGATTPQTVEIAVTEFWGDIINGRSPGATVILNDVTNMAPNAALNDTVLGLWDEKRQGYVFLAPWKGTQAQGNAVVVRVTGGDMGLGCDDSVEEDSNCLYSGVIQTAAATDHCTTKFTDGANVWLVDGRSCHANKRLNHRERYIAVSTGHNFDPGSDERALYAVVDYSPSFRWFRILTDVETFTGTMGESNTLKCREHQCGGDQPDDAPSAWGKWEDIDPCTRDIETIEPDPVLIYFPRYRHRCKPAEEQDFKEKCRSQDADPDCRKNEWVLAFWNPIAERWDAINDAERCIEKEDVAHIVLCSAPENPADANEDCCVFDALKVEFWPRGESYCDPVKERERVWMLCANGQRQITDPNFCALGVRICDALECDGETRPVYLVECPDGCPACICPSTDPEEGGNVIRYTIKIVDPGGPCGFLNDITGTLFCVDGNPFANIPVGEGWAGMFQVMGLTPRFLYFVEHEDFPDGVWLEIECDAAPNGDATITHAWEEGPDNQWTEVGIPNPTGYTSGIIDCEPLVIEDPETEELTPQYRARTYTYGLFVQCGSEGELINVELYLLKRNPSTMLDVQACSGVQVEIPDGPGETISDGESDNFNEGACCDNFMRVCFQNIYFGCASDQAEVPIDELNGLPGTTVCSACDHPPTGHTFGGCPCDWFISGPVTCSVGPGNCLTLPDPFPSETRNNCCEHPNNQLCIEFEWPSIQVGA